jgi:two-component system nitrate/nitrite response regulator NarL
MKVVVADAAAHVRSALRLVLEQHAEASSTVELTSGGQLLAELARACADVLLLDLHLPGLDLANVLPALRQVCPRLRVVVLSSRPEERQHALAAGADAFVSKADAPEALFTNLWDRASLQPC